MICYNMTNPQTSQTTVESERYLIIKYGEQVQRVPVTKGGVIQATLLGRIRLTQYPPPKPPSKSEEIDDSAPGGISVSVPLRLYDPAFKNTAVCNTKISLVDGVDGKLYYRGYDVEELFEKSTYMETSYLLIHGDLPNSMQLKDWTGSIMRHTYLHSAIEKQMSTFRYDCHPMGQLIATMASLSTFTPDANPSIVDPGMYMRPKLSSPPSADDLEKDAFAIQNRQKFIFRALGKIPTIASAVYRHRIGRHYNQPMPTSLSYCENLLFMMFKLNEPNYVPDERIVKIIDKLFILLAENGMKCSTAMMRHLISSGVDPYTALSGAAGALFGERKSSSVISMLKEIGSVDNIEAFLDRIKSPPTTAGKKPPRLMGFGHHIYKSGDPRVRLCKKLTHQLFDVLGCTKNAKIALALEECVSRDEWFVNRNLYPNIDFWTGIIFDTLDFPSDMFPVWCFIPRVSGFIAHCIESLDDPEFKIFRPRQIYIGPEKRTYEPNRPETAAPAIASENTQTVFRPASLTSHLQTDSREGLQTALEDFYNELANVDFAAQFENGGGGSQRELRLGWSLKSWVRKRFGATSSPVAQGIIDKMQEEMQELKLDQEKLARPSVSDGPHGPDLLAGSSHSRVIAKSP